jgi:nicotinamidase-related amidase
MMRVGIVSIITLAAAVACTAAAPVHAANVIDDWAKIDVPPPPELKSVTVDPQTTALLVLDFTQQICNQKKPRCVASLPAVKNLLARARENHVSVVYSTAGNMTPKDIWAEVAPTPGEPVVNSHANKFQDTDLEKILKDKGIKTVICVGTSAVGAVMNTASHAAQIGFEVVVPADGLSAPDLYFEQYAVWQLTHAPVIPPHVTLTTIDMVKF